MTNHWTDIGNTSMVLVFGANPAENHPACMAHVNAARSGGKKAKLVVIDPRLTRTAKQCDPANGDFYVRIRPGTDIAFINGVLNWIFGNIADYKPTASANMLAWHNGTAPNSTNDTSDNTKTRTFIADDGSTIKPLNTDWDAAYYDAETTSHPLATGYPKYCDTRFVINAGGDDYARGVLNVAAKTVTSFPKINATVDEAGVATVWNKLKAHVAKYDLATTADICGCKQDDIAKVAQAIIDNSRFSSSDFGAATATPQADTYKAMTILYAMGQTQHTTGSQNIKGLAVIQTLMGNMGRAGGGINALRGIHNVQGSTDMGLLFDSIPAYSGNPGVDTSYQSYLNPLFGNRVIGTGAKVYTDATQLGLQQRGFHNMTTEFFGTGTSSGADVEKLYNLWPKGDGVQHIQTFRYMALAEGDANRIISAVVWGQNPAVTEPNQTKVRAGLKNLDMLVVVDVYATETAMVDRKDTGITYLIPACTYVEEAGSVTNSGRWLQWRERATLPKGNSKADIELLLRLAYSLDKKGAFSHITDVPFDGLATDAPSNTTVWGTLATPILGPAYKNLYGDKYRFTPGVDSFEEVTVNDADVWKAGDPTPLLNQTVKGSEAVCELVFREMCRPLNYLADGTLSSTTGGTMWIYSGSGSGGATDTTGQAAFNPAAVGLNVMPAVTSAGNTVTWQLANKAKSRNNAVTGADGNNAKNYPRWGWAWLLNRRVFYNNGEVAGDQSDTFVSPGLVSCLFTMNASSKLADWSLVYRAYKTFKDKPSVTTSGHAAHNTNSPHFLSAGYSLAGRFPGHTEPYESPRPDLTTKWGRNTKGGTTDDLVLSDTNIGSVDNYPLVLTSIRCVEHFQGGPTTRNNSFNVEAEPVPWIEINSADARKYNIKDGDWVEVETARGSSTASQETLTPNATAGWAKGFKARVGVGLTANQRVAPGVVAIPWHWGDQGLGTGSRANDLCIDSFDANTTIPEYKACLCKIKVVGS